MAEAYNLTQIYTIPDTGFCQTPIAGCVDTPDVQTCLSRRFAPLRAASRQAGRWVVRPQQLLDRTSAGSVRADLLLLSRVFRTGASGRMLSTVLLRISVLKFGCACTWQLGKVSCGIMQGLDFIASFL